MNIEKTTISIFIFEDRPLYQRLIKALMRNYIFKEKECIFSVAATFEEARKYIAENIYDVITLDGNIKGSHELGYSLIPDIQKASDKTLICMCSANVKHNEYGLRLGAHCAINKDELTEESEVTRIRKCLINC